ncbi:hydrogenase maturation protease [Raineyella sp. LH-20]|uniref:hydrogenase maturation protease n=1 Tax=Raineyella sp. LH-20 TaxID=3081204 RepID=UPI0029550581|nr:hydrogenase maturation protease [Raineyella sp. LH-20]WOP18680.1 hydrogenase maturation protease [Raineyella sp. LH-20]
MTGSSRHRTGDAGAEVTPAAPVAAASPLGARITVLGVGNPIMGDDGVGLALLDAVRQAREGDVRGGDVREDDVRGGDVREDDVRGGGRSDDPDDPYGRVDGRRLGVSREEWLGGRLQDDTDGQVDFIDGGTGGMELLPVVQESDLLLVLDAVAGPVPGTVVHLTGDQVPRMLSTKLSPHQVGLLDVFAAARMLGTEPAMVEVIGIVPELVDLRLGLSAAVAEAVPEAAGLAAGILDQWLSTPSRACPGA